MTPLTPAERAEIAEMMGWKLCDKGARDAYWCNSKYEHVFFVEDWQPDLEWSQAGLVLERCSLRATEIMICFNGMHAVHGAVTGRLVPFYGNPGETLPLAICRFALKLKRGS